jgi:putative endonuclease
VKFGKNIQKNNTRYKFGLHAEQIATIFLRLKGYKILEQRYKTKLGEIDIIARKKSDIIFVEVKARKNLDTYEVLSVNQQHRITNAAKYFISSNKINAKNFRFDLIILKNVVSIKHIKNAF